ncbi:hypothetical protein [Ciceribacter sp. L1K22]|uniref:DUF7694 domain-containing protein n=1 Tax=Ciceribacter sp. L1K22 TaxID=2820275 RepID=UPI001ABED57D|nr:hypothetical protein [Ciceribacter sp. L1K22]MBO3760400.1 hypothetical protein [Ciceribacter sp. L1K22]
MTETRRQRRMALAFERRGLTGKWGTWQRFDVPPGAVGGNGWTREVTEAWRNDLYVVLVRPFVDDNGANVTHLSIRTFSNLEPPWRDLQRIKNELCGSELTGVQVMPPTSELVDGADLYHMWVFATPLPFSIGRGRTS